MPDSTNRISQPPARPSAHATCISPESFVTTCCGEAEQIHRVEQLRAARQIEHMRLRRRRHRGADRRAARRRRLAPRTTRPRRRDERAPRQPPHSAPPASVSPDRIRRRDTARAPADRVSDRARRPARRRGPDRPSSVGSTVAACWARRSRRRAQRIDRSGAVASPRRACARRSARRNATRRASRSAAECREERHQRGFETVRQHDRAIVSRSRRNARPTLAPHAPAEFAVSDRQRDRCRRHRASAAPAARSPPAPGRESPPRDRRGKQRSNQCVRDHHVADPGRTHDQDLHRRFHAARGATSPAKHRRRRACATPDARCVCRAPDRSTAPAASPVIGPRPPLPMARPSSSRIGSTSAAVPVKNASSAM